MNWLHIYIYILLELYNCLSNGNIIQIGQRSSLDAGRTVLAVEEVAAVSILGGLSASTTTSSGKPRWQLLASWYVRLRLPYYLMKCVGK
jgi:hypothetical protein